MHELVMRGAVCAVGCRGSSGVHSCIPVLFSGVARTYEERGIKCTRYSPTKFVGWNSFFVFFFSVCEPFVSVGTIINNGQVSFSCKRQILHSFDTRGLELQEFGNETVASKIKKRDYWVYYHVRRGYAVDCISTVGAKQYTQRS